MPGAKYMTRCPSAAKYEFDAYGAYGKLRIGHAMAEGRLDWNDKALEVMYACTLCGACDVGCKRNLDLEIELSLESLRVKAVKDGKGPMPAHRKIAENIAKHHNMYGADHAKRTDWIPKDVGTLREGRSALLRGLHRLLCEQGNRPVNGKDPQGRGDRLHADGGRVVLREHCILGRHV